MTERSQVTNLGLKERSMSFYKKRRVILYPFIVFKRNSLCFLVAQG